MIKITSNFYISYKRKLGHTISLLVYTLNGSAKRNQKKLMNLHNIYAGKRCFIICNGPSLRPDDLTKIYNNNDISIGMNAVAKIYEQTPWRPTFLSVTDDIVFTDKHKKMVEECECDFKIYDATRYLKSRNAKGELLYLTFDESPQLLDKPKFGIDALHKMPSIGTSAYSVIEFAVFLGCTELYILGCDMSYAVNVNRNGDITYNDTGKEHFYSREKDAHSTSLETPNPTWQLEIAFDYIAAYAKEHNLNIYNATRGGRLESFPRVDFDDLFE